MQSCFFLIKLTCVWRPLPWGPPSSPLQYFKQSRGCPESTARPPPRSSIQRITRPWLQSKTWQISLGLFHYNDTNHVQKSQHERDRHLALGNTPHHCANIIIPTQTILWFHIYTRTIHHLHRSCIHTLQLFTQTRRQTHRSRRLKHTSLLPRLQ